ncbi:hypothetical protein FDP22_13785 [Paroceanicella profunda]|uniref:Uncharacterized protein n=1 Tax=Paroceanicella profunda TaxID=2579971 RepID=A0A5B8G2D2_9RHOB|nr:hypothetical protein [Paroceanicella profunda]QDL92763.1 hypothetical protein FDP22_13785 [Paroceanicella profunda]
MRRALLALTLLLAGCDDPDGTVVTHVIRDVGYDPSIFSAGGVALEIHNTPFEGMSEGDIAGLIALPSGMARDIRMPLVAPGQAGAHQPFRLVLVYNGSAGPATLRGACTADGPLPARPAAATGYTVHAVVCREEKPLLSAYMKATKVAAGDREAITRSMRALFRAMGLGKGEDER